MFNEKNKRNKNVKARKKRSNEGTTVSARLMRGVARGVAFSFLTAFLFNVCLSRQIIFILHP